MDTVPKWSPLVGATVSHSMSHAYASCWNMYFRGAQAAHIVPSTPLSHTLCASVRSTLQHPHPVPLPRHRHRVFASASPPLLLLCFWLWLCWRRCCLDRYFYVRAQIHAHKLLPWQRQQQQQQHSTGTNFLFLPHPGWKKKAKQGCMQHGMDMDMDGFSFRLPTLSLLVSLSISLSPSLHAYSSLLWSFYWGKTLFLLASLPLSRFPSPPLLVFLPLSPALPLQRCNAATLLQLCLLLLLIHTFLIELSRSRWETCTISL